mgnify:CR=1 FL=1
MLKSILVAFTLFIAFADANAQEQFGVDANHELPEGINVGDKAPHIKAHDLDGNLFDSHKVLKGKDIIVIFYRGYWCPACDRHLSNLSDSLQYISEKGAVVVAITPETPENAMTTAENSGANFIILSDHTEELMEEFDVLFKVTEVYQNKISAKRGKGIDEINGQAEANLPVPATFVINKDGNIGYKHFDLDYHNRASVALLISYLDQT